MSCYYCGTTEKELRPYGPGGAVVCHTCAFATPEREKQTEQAFKTLLGAAESVSPIGIAAIGQDEGPIPFDIPKSEDDIP